MGDLFKIKSIEKTDQSANAVIELDESHEIFKGHFPAHPVVPGVCMMQMVEKTLNTVLQREIFLNKASVIKFLAFIDPGKNPEVELQLNYTTEDNLVKVNAQISKDELVFFKFKGEGL